MASKSKHIIRKLFVDVQYHSTADGLQLQREVTDWCRNQLLPQLEAMLEGRWQEDELVKISGLEIELAMDEMQEWQEPALKKLELQLADKLEFRLHGADRLVTTTLTRSFEEQFVFFLLKGYLPWWATVESHRQFLDLLQQWARNENRNSTLIVSALQLEEARSRFLFLLPDESFFQMLQMVYEDQGGAAIPFITHTKQFLEKLAFIESKEIAHDVKQLLLAVLATHDRDMLKKFIHALLEMLERRDWIIAEGAKIQVRSAALHNQIAHLLRAAEMQQPWVVGEEAPGNKGSLEMPRHGRGAHTTTVAAAGRGSRRVLDAQDEAASPAEIDHTIDEEKEDQKTASRQAMIGTEEQLDVDAGDHAKPVAIPRDLVTRPESVPLKPPADTFDDITESWPPENYAQVKEKAAETEPESSVTANHFSKKERPAEPESGQSVDETNRAGARHPGRDAATDVSVERGDAGTSPSPREPGREQEIRQRLLRAIGGTADEEGAIYIGNSGLMILAPFLPVFFKRMDLLDKDSISDYPKAILLLHHLATGNNAAAEYEVVLPKILCGLEPEDPVNLQCEWQESWTGECRDLLLSVIEYWTVLKDTSPEGLREAFVQRNGKLSRVEKDWLLQVEQKPYDMLLQQLPWNITMIRLGWMKRLIRTEWT